MPPLQNNKPRLINLPSQKDERGVLTAIEANSDVPFEIKRVFYMHHIISDRGGHAHINTEQVVIAAHGSLTFTLTLQDKSQKEFFLNDPCTGLYIPPLTFLDITELSADAVCLVLANTHYDRSQSLRKLSDFNQYLDTKILAQ